MTQTPDVYLTVDVEPDCPPFLWTWHGIDYGAPRLLDLLADRQVKATMFTTGNVARRSPALVERITDEGHELASHGMTHRPFARLDDATARWEIEESARVLRGFAPVVSFRAPYLSFPDRYVSMLRDAGYQVDASLAKYKRGYRTAINRPSPVRRVAASLTSSALRLPRRIRDAWIDRLDTPVVLFVHPWEFVDLTRTGIRWDCRARTGEPALRALREVIDRFIARGARFRRIADLVEPGTAV